MAITYNDFTTFSTAEVAEADFSILVSRATDVLKTLSGSHWKDGDTADKAVLYQVEFILQVGGLDAWSDGAGALQSHTYSVGGESESVTYMQSYENGSGRKMFNGLAIAPMAWALLHSSGMIARLGRVTTW